MSRRDQMTDSSQPSRSTTLPETALRMLVDAALDIIAVYDVEGRILFINRAVERVLGYAPERVLRARHRGLLPPRGP